MKRPCVTVNLLCFKSYVIRFTTFKTEKENYEPGRYLMLTLTRHLLLQFLNFKKFTKWSLPSKYIH